MPLKILNAFTDEDKAKLGSIPVQNFGAGYFNGPVITTVTVADTYYKVDATYTPTKETNIEWDGANNRWFYSGDGVSVSTAIVISLTAKQTQNGKKDIGFRVVINGNPVNNEYPDKLLGLDTNAPASVTILVPDIAFNNGDYIELFTTHESSGHDVEVSSCSIMIR